jgi:hypothetical protein
VKVAERYRDDDIFRSHVPPAFEQFATDLLDARRATAR